MPSVVARKVCDVTQARRTGPALETMYQFLLWLVPAVEKFPRGPYPLSLPS